MQVVPAFLQALQVMLPLRTAKPSQLGAMLDRGLVKMTKAVTQIQETHPWCAACSNNYRLHCRSNECVCAQLRRLMQGLWRRGCHQRSGCSQVHV